MGEAPDSSAWVLDDEHKGGNGRQSRRSPYLPHEFNPPETRHQPVALRPSNRSGIYSREDYASEGRSKDRPPWTRVVMYPRRRSDSRSRREGPDISRSIYVNKDPADTAVGQSPGAQSDDCYEVPQEIPPTRREQRQSSMSRSRSSRGGDNGSPGSELDRSASPVSVGSSVLDADAEGSPSKSAPPGVSEAMQGAHRTMKSSGQATKRGKKKVRRRVAKVPSAPPAVPSPPSPVALPGPGRPRGLGTAQTAPAHAPPQQAQASGRDGPLPPGPVAPSAQKPERARRRRRSAPTDGQELASRRVAPPPRRTAAKSAPAPPSGLAPATDVLTVELTEAEQNELKESVVNHVRKVTVQADDDEPDILAEFVCVLLDRRKSSPEMLEELSLMDDEAQPFVAWLQKEKASILARRPPPVPAAKVQAPPDRPPGQFTPLPPRHAMLTPNAVTASLEESGKAGDRSQDRGLVVITNRLILQPNTGHGGHGGHGAHTEQSGHGPAGHSGHRQPEVVDCERVAAASVAERKAEEAHQKKMELLAEMTKELQVIINKLSDKRLSDSMRERYQGFAQTIQNRMSSLSRPAAAEKAEKAYAQAAQEAAAAAVAAATAAGGNSPTMSAAAPPTPRIGAVPSLPGPALAESGRAPPAEAVPS